MSPHWALYLVEIVESSKNVSSCKSSVFFLRVRFLNFLLILANCFKTQVILVSHFVICSFKLVFEIINCDILKIFLINFKSSWNWNLRKTNFSFNSKVFIWQSEIKAWIKTVYYHIMFRRATKTWRKRTRGWRKHEFTCVTQQMDKRVISIDFT